MIYDYEPLSRDDQSVSAEVAELTAAGAAKVFREVAFGAKTDRTQLRYATDQLEAGDLLLGDSRTDTATFHQQRIALQRRDAGEAVTDRARSYAVHHHTISRLLHDQAGSM